MPVGLSIQVKKNTPRFSSICDSFAQHFPIPVAISWKSALWNHAAHPTSLPSSSPTQLLEPLHKSDSLCQPHREVRKTTRNTQAWQCFPELAGQMSRQSHAPKREWAEMRRLGNWSKVPKDHVNMRTSIWHIRTYIYTHVCNTG